MAARNEQLGLMWLGDDMRLPATPPPTAPRLAVQLLTAVGELVFVSACILGFATAVA
jgi:hypothetical protein